MYRRRGASPVTCVPNRGKLKRVASPTHARVPTTRLSALRSLPSKPQPRLRGLREKNKDSPYHFFFSFQILQSVPNLKTEPCTSWSECQHKAFFSAHRLMQSSPLRPSSSAANRGPRSNTRKREREEEISSPAQLPPSSRMSKPLPAYRTCMCAD